MLISRVHKIARGGLGLRPVEGGATELVELDVAALRVEAAGELPSVAVSLKVGLGVEAGLEALDGLADFLGMMAIPLSNG